MTEREKTAVADRVTALEMENTHLRRELFEMRQMTRLREAHDSWERLEVDALKNACDYFGEERGGEWRCSVCGRMFKPDLCSRRRARA